jgi:hypothetical protein
MDAVYGQALDTIVKAGGTAVLMLVAVIYFWTENKKIRAEQVAERAEWKQEREKHERSLELRRRGELRRERRNNRTLMAIAELAPDPEDEGPDPDEDDDGGPA